jgi:two-component system phosphate regulon sensor histidine kinase PhoR
LRLGIRSKLFLAVVTLVIAGLATSGFYLENKLRTNIEMLIETELGRHARTARELIQLAPEASFTESADRLADKLGNASSARVTVIANDGTVLGDSELSPAQIRRVENHRKRPEVLEAIAAGRGLSRRHSTTLGTDMIYLAVPYRRGDDRGVVRVAMPLTEVERAVAGLRLMLFVAAILGVGAAVFISGLASFFLSRTLLRVVKSTRAMAEGRSKSRIPAASQDELGMLAGSINRMAAEVERLVAALAKERDRFEAVLEGMEEGVLALDEGQRITHVNQSAIALLGLDESPVERTLIEVVRVPALHRLISRANQGEPGTLEFDLPGQGVRHLTAHATPLRVSGGVALVIRDMTELLRLEAVRKDFVANVSHELRTPIAIIRANTETLQDAALKDPERAREFLGALQRSADRLSNLIADLLDISRIDSGEYRLDPQDVSVEAVARQTVDAIEKMATEKNLAIESDVQSGLRAHADEKALSQVLFNLLDNAIKYTPAGGHVAVSARGSDGDVRIEVSDDGPGIEPKHRARVFERFYRVDTGRSREMGGTGLGLSIVKNLTEAMGGQVGLETASPRGSVFWLTLPGAAPRT